MIEEFTKRYFQKLQELRAMFEEKHPDDYQEIVKNVVTVLTDDEYESIDPSRIHQIDDGDYQGTLVFVIAAKGYQPNKYWYCRISYGSCSGCDTIEGIRLYRDGKPGEEQIKQYMQLACHVVQQLREMGGEVV